MGRALETCSCRDSSVSMREIDMPRTSSLWKAAEAGPAVRLADPAGAPSSLQDALDSAEVKSVSAALTRILALDPRTPPEATPIACPGAPYRRKETSA